MTFSSPPPPPDSGADSEPAAPPTLPGGGSWGDSDIGAAHAAPAMMFAARPAPPAENDKLPTVGHIGRYALKYPIGSGGLGTVYAAQDPLLSRLIAIKTLNVEIPTEERADFNALFLHEARAAAGLSHPHIVTVFDAGISEAGDESRAYIAMELLKGRDLRQLREEGWRPTPAQAALIVRRVADALAYAHSKGVVHRDVKPANIFMVGRTQPRVLDFGIARVAHQHDGAGGAGDIAAGSPYYMSPEQVRQETVDRRSDVFSLGVVLYELLTGRKPFSGANLEQITGAVLNHEPAPAHEVDAALPAALGEITARAMAKDLDKRFRSARAFSRELRHWLDEHPQAGDSAVPVTPPAAGAPLRRRWAMPAALAAGLCAAAALWVALGDREAPATVEARAVPNVAAPPAAAAPVAEPAPAAGPVAAASAVEPSPAAEPAPTAAPPEPAPALAPAPEIVAAAPTNVAPKPTPAKERRAAREREAKPAPGSAAAPPPTGTLRVAVSPWGEVEVDGRPAGTAPPLTELTLPEGAHRITIRNEDFPPHSTTVNVTAGQAVMVKHRFGS